MNPIKVPYEEVVGYEKVSVGPPENVADEDCGTIEALRGVYEGNSPFDGATVYRVFYKPDALDLAMLQEGAPIEISFISAVVPHTVNVV